MTNEQLFDEKLMSNFNSTPGGAMNASENTDVDVLDVNCTARLYSDFCEARG